MQTKLLRVLQNREVDRVGDTRPLSVDVRVIAATNRQLEKMVADGSFRDDLYYRLAVVAIRIPPLRERTDDLPPLVDYFLEKYAARLGRPLPAVDPEVSSLFNLHLWPGNIRELENVVERALVLDRDGVIRRDDIPDRLSNKGPRLAGLRMVLPDTGLSLEDLERDLLLAALNKHDWNQTKAAAYLAISRSALIYRMQKYGLDKSDAALEPRPTPEYK